MADLVAPNLDPGILKVVESIRKDIFTRLDKYYPNINVVDLSNMADVLEDFATLELLTTISRLSTSLFGLREGEPAGTLLDEDNQIYHIYLSDEVTSHQILNLAIMRMGLVKITLRRKTIEIEGCGRYRKVRFFWPEHLAVRLEFLEALTKVIFEETYGWYKNKVRILVADERVSLTTNLYRYLANIFPDDRVRENFWFACVTESEGFRLIGRDVAEATFRLVDEHSALHGYSTNKLVAEILRTTLPRDKLLMQRAVTLNQCITADLSQAKYKQEGSIYASALEALYGSECFTVFPILTEGRICVVTLFPTTLCSYVEPILSEHRADLIRECERSLSPIKKTLEILHQKAQQLSYGKAGELLGGIIKAFMQA